MRSNSATPSWGQVVLISMFTAATVLVVQHEGTALAGPSGWEKREPQQVDTTRPQDPPPTANVTVAGKQGFYMRKKKQSVPTGAIGYAIAKCDDADDIPVAGACRASVRLDAQSSDMSGWTTNKYEAQYRCAFSNSSGLMADGEAEIVCMRYSPPS